MSEDLIIPTGIPQFVGELGTLEKEAKSLASNAKLFRDSGSSVHSSFQGLSACYKAPEADKLFATTTPVATKSDGFADDLEKVSSALDAYASEVRPLAAKLATLKEQAIAFVASVEGDDDWRKDKKKTDRNDELWHSVNATVAAFHAAERACHDKIVALVGGKSLIADDGSHKSNMYGYKASDLDRAEETPWGSMAEREYTGLAWLRHQAKSFLWDGIVMDGIVGTAKGVATLFGSEGWDKAGEAWTGLAKLATGVVISISPLSGAYWMASDDQLPGWFRDSRTTLKQTGKAFVAYDQWGKNPARAAGGVTFNVLTTITGGAGAAAKGGAAAKTFAAAGKVGRLIDPITYVGKAGKFTFVKVGDLMSGLKTLNPGSSLRIAGETFRLADEATAAKLAERPAGLPRDVAEFVDNKGRPVYMNPKTGQLFDEHGKVKQPAESVPKEGSAAERAAEHARASQPERVPVGAGARAGSEVTASVGRTGDNVAGGAGRDALGGSGPHTPGSTARDLGRGSSAGHGTPGSNSGSHSPRGHGDHGSPHHGGHGEPHHGSHGNGGASHADDAAHQADDASTRHDGGHGDGPATDVRHRAEGRESEHGGGGKAKEKELTPEQMREAVRKQVEKANTDPVWFDEYYRSDGHRVSKEVRDENGHLLPILRWDETGGQGRWIAARDAMQAEPPKYKLAEAIPGRPSTVHADHIDRLREAAAERRAAIDHATAAKHEAKAAKTAWEGNPTDELKAKYDEALKKRSEAIADSTKKSEMFGEDAAEYHAIPDHYPGANRLDDGASGNNRFDQIWHDPRTGRMVVVEAKSSKSTELGDREGLTKGKRVSQGTREYFEVIIGQMNKRGETDLADQLMDALDSKKLDYVLVKGNPKGSTYGGYEMNHFDID
ncbi:hypothetical protein ACFWAT_19665 [Streptomyces syringium]|uniref:hypothetical protein n=1 Tax=Streptomyces syringium TaxID=76729 RepID=UPI00365639CB